MDPSPRATTYGCSAVCCVVVSFSTVENSADDLSLERKAGRVVDNICCWVIENDCTLATANSICNLSRLIFFVYQWIYVASVWWTSGGKLRVLEDYHSTEGTASFTKVGR